MAFQSLVKLAAFLFVGVFAVKQVFFGSMDGLSHWLGDQPQLLEPLAQRRPFELSYADDHLPCRGDRTAAPVSHCPLREPAHARGVRATLGGFPLLLLLLCLPILLVWAGMQLELGLPVEYFAAGVGLNMGSPAVALLVFIGGLSAARVPRSW
ncbi:MAG: hypothetical protein IPJ33_19545 [Gammaproteobacteria bacterium]|nr:hypothetical protein [Gammaproteobacteria bacterium]